MDFPKTLSNEEMALRLKEWELVGIGVLRNDNRVVLITEEERPGPRCDYAYYKQTDGSWRLRNNDSVVYCPDGGYWCTFDLEKECNKYFGLTREWAKT